MFPAVAVWAKRLPVLCIVYRVLVGPVLLWAAWQNYRAVLVAVFVLAVVSDIVDGMIAA